MKTWDGKLPMPWEGVPPKGGWAVIEPRINEFDRKKTMNLTKTPALSVIYAPGLLAVMQREPCPMHNEYHNISQHGWVQVVKHVTLLQPGEQSWCLERSWIPQEVNA